MKKALLVIGIITGGVLGYLFKDEITEAIKTKVEKKCPFEEEMKDYADM